MVMVQRPQAAPPLLDLDDAGVRWHREGTLLVVEGRPPLRSVAFRALLALGLGLAALTMAPSGRPLAGFALAGLAALALLGVLAALARHTALRAGHSGLHWETKLPRRRAGKWARPSISAVRVRGEDTGPWAVGKQVVAEVRVAGEWVAVGLGHSPARANDFVSGLCTALGVRREESAPHEPLA